MHLHLRVALMPSVMPQVSDSTTNFKFFRRGFCIHEEEKKSEQNKNNIRKEIKGGGGEKKKIVERKEEIRELGIKPKEARKRSYEGPLTAIMKKQNDDGPITMILKTNVHCEGCDLRIKKAVDNLQGNGWVCNGLPLTMATTLMLWTEGTMYCRFTRSFSWMDISHWAFHSKLGCDASVLLNSTMMNTVEKQAPPNKIVRGYGVIDSIKAKLEEKCPKTVSCADILALVARDVTYLSKGPRWEVPTGRRDGRMSVFSEFINLPPPFLNFTQLKGSFVQNGLSVKDLVVLSGSHTIGISQCSSFTDRLYNFTGKGITDPSLDSEYAAKLKIKCKPNDVSTVVEMDPGSFLTFDNSYYKLVAKRRGLFTSDKSLLDDPETRAYVFKQANSKNSYEFFSDFATSMVKMGNIRVLTGFQGEIRKHCAFVN